MVSMLRVDLLNWFQVVYQKNKRKRSKRYLLRSLTELKMLRIKYRQLELR